MKRCLRLMALGGGLAMIGEASAGKTTATTPNCSPSTRTTGTTSRRKLSKKGSSEGGGGLELLEEDFCETFAGAAGCATANGEQVVPLELGNDNVDAYLQFYYNEDKTEMIYSISIDGEGEDLDSSEGSLEVSLYCGFAGAPEGTLLAELEFLVGEDEESSSSVLTKADLLTNDEDAPVECEGRPVEEILDLFDLMVDGTIFFEVMLNDAASEDDTSEASYVRGQVFL